MIRNVVVGRLRAGADEALLDRAIADLSRLRTPGLLDLVAGRDLRLRDGGWDYAITATFADADAYRVYDLDEEHNRIRRELFGPVSEEIVRVQFALPPGD